MTLLNSAEIWRSVAVRGERTRADAGLRRFARRVGDARMCRRCDGDGLVLYGLGPLEPRRCGRCGGKGLEPPETDNERIA